MSGFTTVFPRWSLVVLFGAALAMLAHGLVVGGGDGMVRVACGALVMGVVAVHMKFVPRRPDA